MGWARLPMLVAGFSLASILAATAQTPPADEDPDMAAAAEEAAAAPDVNDADIMKDIDVSKLDWSQLNVDAVDPDGAGAEERRRGERPQTARQHRGRPTTRPNGTSAVSVKQSITPFWDTRIGADMTVARQGTLTDVRTAVGKTRQWRQPAAILRHRLGGDHRARRRLDLGQDLGRSPRRSRHRSRASSAPP